MADKATIAVHSQIKSVPLAKFRVSPSAQRDLRPARVDYLVANFDPEQFGYPVVNFRDGHYYIIDGQHRVAAAKDWLGTGWETQNIDCRVYSGLSEKQEADTFDRLNDHLAVRTFDKFKVRVTAGRPAENAIKKIVEKQGLKIAEHGAGAVRPVGALERVYRRSDGPTLSRALRILHQSFGDPGLSSSVIDGFGRLCERYNGALDDSDAIEKLAALRGGVGALMTRAELLRKQTRAQLAQCVAAAVVDVLNQKRGGKKLPSWWAEQ